MNLKTYSKILVAVIVSIICCYASYILFQRSSSEVRWGVSINRYQAKEKAIAYAKELGYKVDDFSNQIDTDYNSSNEYYISKLPDSVASRFISPVSFEAEFEDPSSKDQLRIVLGSNGSLRELTSETKSKNPPPSSNSAENLDKSRSIAFNTAHKILGNDFNSFTPSDAIANNQGYKFQWKFEDEYITLEYLITVKNSKIINIKRTINYSDKFKSDLSSSTGKLRSYASQTDAVFFIPTIMLALALFFIGIAQKTINHKLTLTFAAVIFIFNLAGLIFGGDAASIHYDFKMGNTFWAKVVPIILAILAVAFVTLLVTFFGYILYAAGLSVGDKKFRKHIYDLQLLLSGKILNDRVILSIITGLVAGAVITFTKYLPTIFYNFGLRIRGQDQHEVFKTILPESMAIDSSMFLVLFVFVLLAAIISKYITLPTLSAVTIYLVAFITLTTYDAEHGPLVSTVISSSISAFILTYAWHKIGIISVFIAEITQIELITAYNLLSQPAQGFHSSGTRILIELAILTILSLVALTKAGKAPEINLEDIELQSESDRERLKAEIELAAQAQQKLLPKSFPQIEGFDVAALCVTAGEVGGDLYDFIHFRNNKIGIVVADVSGKGVPASLYMTFTKGLIDSVSEETDDPGEILREVNKRLFDVCGRKMFVTLFMGIINPALKQMTYARAGHNPTIYNQGNSSSKLPPLLLKSPGIGLGMNSGKIFDAVLKVQTLNLGPSDTLLFYSDGITEAMNQQLEEFGEERLMNTISQTNGHTAQQTIDVVMAEVKSHLNGRKPQDDQTIVVVKVN